jgi:hypothetical protein
MNGMQIAQCAKEQLMKLTLLKAETVSAISKDERGWHITVEMLEMKCIPDSHDMLATYETLLDDDGELISYQRTCRYHREQVMEKEE